MVPLPVPEWTVRKNAPEPVDENKRSDVSTEKYIVAEYAKAKGFKSAVNVGTGWYMENHFNPEVAGLLGGLPYTEDEDGYLTLAMPNWGGDNTIPFVSIGDDYGDIVHGVLLDPETYNGQFVQGFSELATPEELVAAVQKGACSQSNALFVVY